MKLQNLSIIFLVIAIPLIMILSYYLSLQQDTLELQAEYDTKLSEATKEGIKAFEVNTVDWSTKSGNNVTRRENVKATINTFITSLSNQLNVTGTAKEYMLNYIPAIAVTMYDGYYVYAPTYAPVPYLNDEGKQLFYDSAADEYKTEVTDKPVFKKDDDTKTTNLDEAKYQYEHMLTNQIAYSEEYSHGSNTNVVVNYTLDNRIYVYGKVDGDTIKKDGYLVYFQDDTNLPRINEIDGAEIKVDLGKGVNNTIYAKSDTESTHITPEILEEQILYKASDGNLVLGTFKYVYDITHDKLYYDDSGEFFTISNNEKVFITNADAKYKSVSVLFGTGKTTQYKKIYQRLNGDEKGKWFISLEDDPTDIGEGIEEVDTILTATDLYNLGLYGYTNEIYKDFSAISYYVEAYAFTNWVEEKLGDISVEVEGDNVNIFKITSTNDLEKEYSPISVHKKEIIKENITTNLNLAISNFGHNAYEYKMPVLTDSDWDQVLSNVSMITFFQGIPIGLKYYNNYAIATSTNNREYVDPGEIYFSGEDDTSYHRVYCDECNEEQYTGYRSVEYVLREYSTDTGNNISYYQHDNISTSNTNSETACYYCLVNKENFVATTDEIIINNQAEAYDEAIARERYYQAQELAINIYPEKTVTVTKKKITTEEVSENLDVVVILDYAYNTMPYHIRDSSYIGFVQGMIGPLNNSSNVSSYAFVLTYTPYEKFVGPTDYTFISTNEYYTNNDAENYKNAFETALNWLENKTGTRCIVLLSFEPGYSYFNQAITTLSNNINKFDKFFNTYCCVDLSHLGGEYSAEQFHVAIPPEKSGGNLENGDISSRFDNLANNTFSTENSTTEYRRSQNLIIELDYVDESRIGELSVSYNGIEILEPTRSVVVYYDTTRSKYVLDLNKLIEEEGITVGEWNNCDIEITYYATQL